MSKKLAKKSEEYKMLTPSEAKVLIAIWKLTRNNFQPVSYDEIANYLEIRSATIRKIVSVLIKNRKDLLIFFRGSTGIGRGRTFLKLSESIVGKPETALILLELLKFDTNHLQTSQFVKDIHEKYGLDISDIEFRVGLLIQHEYICEPEKDFIFPTPKLWEQMEYLKFVAQNYIGKDGEKKTGKR
jgi:hypothetical protein